MSSAQKLIFALIARTLRGIRLKRFGRFLMMMMIMMMSPEKINPRNIPLEAATTTIAETDLYNFDVNSLYSPCACGLYGACGEPTGCLLASNT